MSGHTVTIRVLLLKRQEHHLNALAGNCPAFLSMSIYIATKFFVEVAGVEPTCNQLRLQHGISVSRYTSIFKTHPAGIAHTHMHAALPLAIPATLAVAFNKNSPGGN